MKKILTMFVITLALSVFVFGCSERKKTGSAPNIENGGGNGGETGGENGGNGGNGGNNGGQGNETIKLPTKKEVEDAVKELETSKKIPVLDRSDSIAGTDADKNGIRDDIDAFIDSLPDSQEQKNAMRQSARADQQILLLDLNNKDAIMNADTKSLTALQYLFYRYPDNEFQRDEELTKYTYNTKARADIYMAYNGALSGTTWKLDEGEHNCE